MTEADTCRTYVVPKLHAAGWSDEQIREQVTFTDGRIIPIGATHARRPGKRADYILRYRADFPIAVVEAKAEYRNPGDGLQQAMDYAEILGYRFAYSTNGRGIVEHDYSTGLERKLEEFPSPDELWGRYRGDVQLYKDKDADDLLYPFHREVGKQPRYYQEIAINRAVQAVVKEQKRILITMATGTGKTFVAFQIVWKLWKSRRKKKILFLADRNILVDYAEAHDFSPLGDAATKIQTRAHKSREIFFAIYQAIADRDNAPGLYREYPRDFFDLIIVDECHRGSAKDESNWRQILEYFEPATQIGMTATPKRDANVDTYNYFGDPVYTYSLKTGIDDGFLAPYRVQRVVPNVDALGWRPASGERDRFGREIPDGLYGTKDYERVISILARTQAVAKHLTQYLRATGRMAKTIVFCVDQEHAEDMRLALAQENADLVKKYPHYVARVVSDEKRIGRGYLDDFQDPEKATPVIVTTSQMLTTGVDVPTCKNVVLFKPIGSIVEFKQIIGRGTRVRADFDKLWFTIIDYTGATALFTDPLFDGDPETPPRVETIDAQGNVIASEEVDVEPSASIEVNESNIPAPPELPIDAGREPAHKYYVDDVPVWITAEQAFELAPDGHVLRTVEFTRYAREQIRRIAPNTEHLHVVWGQAQRRDEIIHELRMRGVDLDHLAKTANQPDADPLDLLLYVAYNAPCLSRRERAQQLKSKRATFFNTYTPAAREVLEVILDKYADYGFRNLQDWSELLKVEPLNAKGTPLEIAALFGGAVEMKCAVEQMQALLYSD
ncbi:MAG: DEAD/DEAH box helicase family protein [Chloroflexi bacterium]|nr:DEAD/DEAH box helicase family protein [Chloroflexota bacterium]